ncbi:MAG: hypothetical protein LC114_15620 [Bryobacterales bacterium]|nr:hypothetical protein [Bryobacterales bacterium]
MRTFRSWFSILVCTLIACLTLAAEAAIQVDGGIPGGNIIVESVAGDTIRVRQDLRDTQGQWFYWAFRVRGAAGRTLHVEFTDGNVIGVRGPAVSTDGGQSWQWLGADAVEGASFRYQVPSEVSEVRFSMNIPYFESDLRAFLERHAGNPSLEVGVLAESRKGRPIEQLRLGRLDGGAAHRVLLTARHHACESLASYSLEGILEAILSSTDDGRWLRENVEFLVVPFMDKDGVEDGDQGKNRRPHDHNRDYNDESIHPSVAALRREVPGWSGGKLDFALDMHCPYIRGKDNKSILFVGVPNETVWGEIERFSQLLESTHRGPLPYRRTDNLAFGVSWNKPESGRLKSFDTWASEQPGIRFASTIEIPYAEVRGVPVTPEAARALGADLARAMRMYLENLH